MISKEFIWNAKIIESIGRLPDFNLTVKEWTEKVQMLCKDAFNLNTHPDFDLKFGTFRTYHKKSINELFQRAANSNKVTTVHKAKGKTFVSLMIVLSKDSRGQSISLNDIGNPTRDMPNEKARLIYVGMSRPRWQLVIGVPNTEGTKRFDLKVFGKNIKVHVV